MRLLRTEANVEFNIIVVLLTGSEGQGGGQDGQQVDGDAAVAEDLPPGLLEDGPQLPEDVANLGLAAPQTQGGIWGDVTIIIIIIIIIIFITDAGSGEMYQLYSVKTFK